MQGSQVFAVAVMAGVIGWVAGQWMASKSSEISKISVWKLESKERAEQSTDQHPPIPVVTVGEQR